MRATPLTIRLLERLPALASLATLVIAGVVAAGWMLGLPILASLLPWGSPMLPQTAMAITLGAVALACVRAGHRWLRWLGVVFAVLLGLMAAVSFRVHLIPGTEFLERVLFRGGHGPNHLLIPANSAVALLFLSLALIVLGLDRFRESRKPQLLAAMALTIAFVALVGYSFGVTGLYQPTAALGMTAWAVVAIHALSLGVIFARPNIGFPALLTDRGAGGRLARRLLPGAILIPYVVAWVIARVERAGYFSAYVADSLITVVTVIALVWIISRGARVVHRAEKERAQLFLREQHEREVAEQALIAAETASSAKSDFLAVMSHELRTPLTAIIGYEELLADEITGPVNAQQSQQLSRIKASAQHLLGLIDEILTFSRLEAGRETVRIEPVDVNTVIQDAASIVSPLAAEKKLGCAIYPLDPPRQMRTDPGKIRQILVNLLSNSVKFTTQGGITLTTATENSELVVRVCDTGVGIAPENRERVFEPFWQAEQKATRRAGGTGLGLTVTRRLARLLGGDVTLESAPGEGAMFTVRLPGVLPLAARVTPPVERASAEQVIGAKT